MFLFDNYMLVFSECLAPVMSPAEPVVPKLVALISIPILLVLVGTITGLFFFRRGNLC